MSEEIEQVAGTTEASTDVKDSSYSEILTGEGTAPETKPIPEVQPEEESPAPKTEESQPEAQDPNAEVVVEVSGKQFTVKQGELIELLESANKLAEKERNLDKGYTQKFQQLAAERKSFEDAFGRMPDTQEVKALGKVWKSYFTNPQAREAIDSILNGNFQKVKSEPGKEGKPADSYTQALEQKIQGLESQLGQFMESIDSREQSNAVAEGQRVFNSWLSERKQSGKPVSEGLHEEVLRWAGVLRQMNPDLDGKAALDRAYRHVTIDDLKKEAVSEVLVNADKAKRTISPKITPKAPAKAEKDMSYSELIRSAM